MFPHNRSEYLKESLDEGIGRESIVPPGKIGLGKPP